LTTAGLATFPICQPAVSTTVCGNHKPRKGQCCHGPKGETFADAANAFTESIAPHLACSTARRQSHLRFHLLPRFGASALMALDVRTVQRFATELLQTNNRKTILNVLGTFFAVLDYARKCDTRVPEFKFSALTIAPEKEEVTPYFKPTAAAQIIAAAKEPYRTIF
jgi:hypothetical protein